MKHKYNNIFHYFLFFILLGAVIANNLCFAASVDTVKKKANPADSSEHESLNKNRAYMDYYYSTLNFVQPSEYIEPSQNTPPFKSNSNSKSTNTASNNSLYSLGKKIVSENKENAFLQGSLLVFSNTKHFLKETDLMLYNLTEDILLSLNIDSLIDNSLRPLLKTQLQTPYSDEKQSTYSYQTQDDSYRLMNLEGESSEKSGGGGDGNFRDMLKKLLNLENLLYLIGALIFYIFLSMTIKFMLTEKLPK